MLARALLAIGGALAAAASARAQVVNGDFETGGFAPWVVTNTPQGTAVVTAVGPFDIDGPAGPLPQSLCAQVMAGQGGGGNTGPQGVIIHQTVQLEARAYTFSFNWAVLSYIPVPNSSGGIFELMLDGNPIVQGAAPVMGAGERAYGEVAVSLTLGHAGGYDVGVRITRTVAAGYEQMQHVDNFEIEPACPADFNHDGALNSQDLFDYLNAFFASGPGADYNLDGLINSQDFFDFLGAFFGGC